MNCKWLFWDGSYRRNGDCNRSRDGERVAPTARLYLPRQVRDGRPLRVMVPCAVAVEILEVVERGQLVALKLKCHNPHLIRSLLRRVSLGPPPARAAATPVYQEVLTGGEVQRLAPADESAGGLPPFPPATGLSVPRERLEAAFHFQVWVSVRADAFAEYPARASSEADPRVQFGVQVHDRSRPTEAEIGRRLALLAGETRQLVVARKLRREAASKDGAGSRTAEPYRLHLAPGAALPRVRDILAEAARTHQPFTEALMAVARADENPDP